MDCYEIIPGVASEREPEKWLVEHDHLGDRAPKTLRPYPDYRSIGANYRSAREGAFLAGGYIGIRTAPWSRFRRNKASSS